jgi:hypothetical protein
VLSGPDAFVCSDFAEAVHNNAEAAGIKAAWVSLTFEGTKEGHALDAFETTDKGLIYIYCTNSSGAENQGAPHSIDAIAYVETGKKYGVLPVARVLAAGIDSYPLEYDFYAYCDKAWQEYETKLKSYNDEADRYNKETGGRVYIVGTPEANRVSAWKQALLTAQRDLESLKAQSGDRWLESEYSSYLIKNVNIHW